MGEGPLSCPCLSLSLSLCGPLHQLTSDTHSTALCSQVARSRVQRTSGARQQPHLINIFRRSIDGSQNQACKNGQSHCSSTFMNYTAGASRAEPSPFRRITEVKLPTCLPCHEGDPPDRWSPSPLIFDVHVLFNTIGSIPGPCPCPHLHPPFFCHQASPHLALLTRRSRCSNAASFPQPPSSLLAPPPPLPARPPCLGP